MDVEREKMIRDTWDRHRSRLMPILRREGSVRCTPPLKVTALQAYESMGEQPELVTTEILIFEAMLPPGARYLNSAPGIHDRTPGKVVCEGIELEEIP